MKPSTAYVYDITLPQEDILRLVTTLPASAVMTVRSTNNAADPLEINLVATDQLDHFLAKFPRATVTTLPPIRRHFAQKG